MLLKSIFESEELFVLVILRLHGIKANFLQIYGFLKPIAESQLVKIIIDKSGSF